MEKEDEVRMMKISLDFGIFGFLICLSSPFFPLLPLFFVFSFSSFFFFLPFSSSTGGPSIQHQARNIVKQADGKEEER